MMGFSTISIHVLLSSSYMVVGSRCLLPSSLSRFHSHNTSLHTYVCCYYVLFRLHLISDCLFFAGLFTNNESVILWSNKLDDHISIDLRSSRVHGYLYAACMLLCLLEVRTAVYCGVLSPSGILALVHIVFPELLVHGKCFVSSFTATAQSGRVSRTYRSPPWVHLRAVVCKKECRPWFVVLHRLRQGSRYRGIKLLVELERWISRSL